MGIVEQASYELHDGFRFLPVGLGGERPLEEALGQAVSEPPRRVVAG